MDNRPIIEHIRLMLEHLDHDAIRAIYMVVKELYRLQKPN